jgi:hypothetical protein
MGKRAGTVISAGGFTFLIPKNLIQQNHNKEAKKTLIR